MTVTQEQLDAASIAFCMPVTLLVNFSLFQYLLTLYYKRRREYHGLLLLLCAFLGFAAIVPFASSKRVIAGHLNDVSETASTTTFLVQITMVSRDVTKKLRIPMVRGMLLLSELFTALQLLVLVINFVQISMPDEALDGLDGLDNLAEELALVFIFLSRFYFLYMARGWRFLMAHKKLELFVYTLFLTHEYPFAILEAETGVSWEPVQSLWHRTTMALCISLTLKEKFRSSLFSNSNSKHKMTSHEAQASELSTKGKTASRVCSAVLSKPRAAVTPHLPSGPSTKSLSAIRASFKAARPARVEPSATPDGSPTAFNEVAGMPGAADKSMTRLQVGAHTANK